MPPRTTLFLELPGGVLAALASEFFEVSCLATLSINLVRVSGSTSYFGLAAGEGRGDGGGVLRGGGVAPPWVAFSALSLALSTILALAFSASAFISASLSLAVFRGGVLTCIPAITSN